MYFQILEIILWPRNESFKPRRLPFKSGSVNVISGVSRTGKSAIIPIIDYCFGADKCTIPVNTIRDSCSWFGVIVDTIQGRKLFARREPGLQKTTGDMFTLEGTDFSIPDTIMEKNTSADAVKRSLDELAGLTALDFDFENLGSGFKGRPSFRDLAAFVFQPQNVVANPNVLFYKADTQEHREKLRTIFPYILGAVTPELLAKYHELSQLKKSFRRKQIELSNVKQVSERWMAEVRSRAVEASVIGLLPTVPSENASREELVAMLQSVVAEKTDELQVSSETISGAIRELNSLNEEDRELSLQLTTLRKRLGEMSALQEGAKIYKGSLLVQRDRLKLSDWIQEKQVNNHDCPICGNLLDSSETTSRLTKALREVEHEAGEFEIVPASFDREFQRVKGEIDLLTERIGAVKIRIQALKRTSQEAQKSQFDSLRASRFIGNVEQALLTFSQLGTDGELSTEVEELRDRIRAIESVLSEATVKEREKRALLNVSMHAGRLLPQLDVERPDDPVELLINDLTIRVSGASRGDYLWEIGSGSNWLAYHIAMTLALHQFFLNLETTPIPSFIAYDQPSQVYFPKHLREDIENPEDLSTWQDEDVGALRKVFKVFSEIVTQNAPKFQIIVFDHAPDHIWKDLPNVHAPEEWREGNTLVPREWLFSGL